LDREGDEKWITVVNDIKNLVHFGQFNLLLNYPFTNNFDVIFCRNVLIYFERKDADYVVTQMRDKLRIGGYLFLGHSETAAGNVRGLRRIGPAIYVRE
jgi:chemotaxis protein methyltransferase CheR